MIVNDLSSFPKFSIITPTLNQAEYIRQTIESVLNQDYPNIEYLVIDGGSTDSTLDILQEYGDRFQWVSEKDHGQADAINKGIRKATGDIVAFINSDDYLQPGALRLIANHFLKKPECKWLTGDYIIINQQGQPIQPLTVFYKRLYRRYSSPTVLAFTNYIIQPSTFWKRKVHDEIGYFDEALKFAFDYDFWMRLMQHYPPYCITQQISAFRIHPQSKGGKEYEAQFQEELGVLKRYTKNTLSYFFHKLHNLLIIGAYRIIK